MTKLTRCKLKKNTQIRLLEYFVLEVTTRSAANMLGIQANTAILFYRKLRQIISYHLALEACEIFDGCVELDESFSTLFNASMPAQAKKFAKDKLIMGFKWVDPQLQGKQFILGEKFSVADPYLLTVVRWC